jgi:hypothetical protein
MGRRRWVAAACAAVPLLVSACTPAQVRPQPTPVLPPGTSSLTCDDSIGTTDGTDTYVVVLDDVAVASGMLTTAASGFGAGSTHLFAKWGLLVRDGVRQVELSLDDNTARTARIGWGQPGEPSTTVLIDACPTTNGGAGWTVFAGGTWVASPACVPLVITSGSRQTVVHLEVGAPCPVPSTSSSKK